VCWTKQGQKSGKKEETSKSTSTGASNFKPKASKVHQLSTDRVQSPDSSEEDSTEQNQDRGSQYAFQISTENRFEETDFIPVTVGGIIVKMLTDSGCQCNIIPQSAWENLKKKNIKCVSKKVERCLYSYRQKKSLKVLGTFTADVSVKNGSSEKDVSFVVYEGDDIPLLDKETAQNLNVLRVGLCVNSVIDNTSMSTIMGQYESVFQGIGKLKDFRLLIPIDKDVKPVIQPLRRIPYNLRDLMETELKDLLLKGITERIEGHTPWLSPALMVPKRNGT
jgi:hypothetical protein